MRIANYVMFYMNQLVKHNTARKNIAGFFSPIELLPRDAEGCVNKKESEGERETKNCSNNIRILATIGQKGRKERHKY